MSVCAHRPEDGGMFRNCPFPCKCRAELPAEDLDAQRLAELVAGGMDQVEASHQIWPAPKAQP